MRGRPHSPLVACKRAAGLEHPEDLLVASHSVGGVAGGVNGVHGIKRVGLKGHLHEVTLGEPAALADAVADLGRAVRGAGLMGMRGPDLRCVPQ